MDGKKKDRARLCERDPDEANDSPQVDQLSRKDNASPPPAAGLAEALGGCFETDLMAGGGGVGRSAGAGARVEAPETMATRRPTAALSSTDWALSSSEAEADCSAAAALDWVTESSWPTAVFTWLTPWLCSFEPLAISRTSSFMRRALSAMSLRLADTLPLTRTPCSLFWMESVMRSAVSLAARAERWARGANLVGDDCESGSGFACAGGFDGGVEGEDVGLEGDFVDGLDYFGDVVRGGLDFTHGTDHFLHVCGAVVGGRAGLGGDGLGVAGVLGVAFGHAGNLFQSRAGLLKRGGLFTGSLGEALGGRGDFTRGGFLLAAGGVNHGDGGFQRADDGFVREEEGAETDERGDGENPGYGLGHTGAGD